MARQAIYLDHNASAPLLPEARAALVDVLEPHGQPLVGPRSRPGAAQPHRDGARPGGGAGRRRADAGGVHRLGDRGDHPGDRGRREGASARSGRGQRRGAYGGAQGGRGDRGAGHDASISMRTASSGSTRSRRRSRPPMRLASSCWSRCMRSTTRPAWSSRSARIEAMVGPTPHYLFVDAVQALGKLPLEFAARAPDMMAVSAHKIGGPAGVGALLVKGHADAARLIPGGGQETGPARRHRIRGADRGVRRGGGGVSAALRRGHGHRARADAGGGHFRDWRRRRRGVRRRRRSGSAMSSTSRCPGSRTRWR